MTHLVNRLRKTTPPPHRETSSHPHFIHRMACTYLVYGFFVQSCAVFVSSEWEGAGGAVGKGTKREAFRVKLEALSLGIVPEKGDHQPKITVPFELERALNSEAFFKTSLYSQRDRDLAELGPSGCPSSVGWGF